MNKSEMFMRKKMSRVISKLFCAGLCVVLLAGCGQVHTIEDVADVSGTTSEQTETGQSAIGQEGTGQSTQESKQNSEAMTESGNLPAESVSPQEELDKTQDITGSQATLLK